MHCLLWLHAAEEKAPPSVRGLDRMMGEEGFAAAGVASDEQWQWLTAGLPDFGFVIGRRWTLADRMTRHRFNRLFARHLARKSGISGDALSREDRCAMQVRTELADRKQAELPSRRRHYVAHARTRLTSSGGTVLPLVYALEKRAPEAWRVTGMTIGGVALSATYGGGYNRVIAGHGFSGLLEMLEGAEE